MKKTLKILGLVLVLAIMVQICVTINPQTVLAATVETYPGLPGDLYKSDRYIVSVDSNNSYVYKSINTYDPSTGERQFQTDDNNFTSFSFSGAVTVTVTLPLRTAPERFLRNRAR